MATRNLYQVLGLAPGVDHEQIKTAFRALAKRSHPDVNADSHDTEERFKEFCGAYEILGDPARRATYDLVLVQERNRRRRRFWQAAATMLASFIVTIGTGSTAFILLQRPPLAPLSEVAAPSAVANSEIASISPAQSQLASNEQAFGYHENSIDVPTPAESSDAGFTEANAAMAVIWLSTAPESAAPAIHHDAELQPGAVDSTQVSPAQLPEATLLPALPQSPPDNKAATWTTYRNTRFGFSLKIPDAIFLRGEAAADVAENMWVSRDGRSVLHITSVPNMAGIKAAQHRRLLMQQRYGGATLDYAPEKANWFVLSGTLGEEMFYERVTLSCDGRSMHSWQLVYPVSERAVYDRVVEEMHRSYRHGARCGDDRRETAQSSKTEPSWRDIFPF